MMKSLRAKCGGALRPGLLRLIACLMFFGTHAFSQRDNPEKAGIPPGPLLNPLPDFSQWVVSISYPDEKAHGQTAPNTPAGPPMAAHLKLRPREITTIKTHNLVHEVISVIEGPQQEKWYVDSIQYWKIAQGMDWFVNQPGASGTLEEGYTPLPRSGFRDLDWISDTTFANTESYGGAQCLVFKSTAKAGSDEQARIAYIDLKTRWPVEVRIAGEVRTYKFVGPPSAMQTLPDDLKAQIARGERVKALINMRPPTAP